MDSDGRPGQMRQKRPTVVDDDTPFKDDDDLMEESDSLAARLFSGRATTNLADLQQENFFDRLEQRNPQDSVIKPSSSTISDEPVFGRSKISILNHSGLG